MISLSFIFLSQRIMNKKKKILIFTPGGLGGAERMCITIGQLLDKEEFNVQYVIWGRGKAIFDIIPEGANVDTIPFLNVYCFSTFRVWWKIIKSKPDIVFSSLSFFNPRVIIAAKLARRKVIIRSSGMVGDYGWWKFFKLKLTCPWADLLIAQQEDMRQEMIKMMNLSPGKVVTYHNPVDFTDIEKKKTALSPFVTKNTTNYVNVARINWHKGQDVAIKALSKIKQFNNNAHLWLIGSYNKSDSYYQELINLVKTLNLEDCVHFTGHEENPFKWVQYCDCFVFPSRHEGLPNALVEASYLGTPCVAARCLNVVVEIVKDGYNGYVVDVDDIDGLAGAMKKAIKLKDFAMTYKPGTAKEINRIFDSVIK